MNRFALTFAFALALSSAAFAQVPAQQTAASVALQIDSVVNSWAQTLEVQQKQIAELQKQLAELKKKDAPASKAH